MIEKRGRGWILFTFVKAKEINIKHKLRIKFENRLGEEFYIILIRIQFYHQIIYSSDAHFILSFDFDLMMMMMTSNKFK